MSSPKRRSYEAETELANLLWKLGFAVIRGPASGGGARKRFQPDLVAVKEGRVLVLEIKRFFREEGPLYLESSQVMRLQEWARRAGGTALIAVRLSGGEWRIHNINDLKVTKGGNFKLDDPKKGLRLRDFLEIFESRSRPLTEYMDFGKQRDI
ncbi:MAG: Holliday junction resolvase Hjc [Acidilobaceae archaeon]